jgi:hypothetical protein
MDDEPSGIPAKLPSDYQAFRRSYRWLLLYGPWALGFIGLLMVAVGLFVDRPGEVALTSIGFGSAMVIAGVLLPRMRGQLEFGPGGVKGAVEGLPQALMLVEVAREAAEQAIPADEPDKERKVNEVVGHTVSGLAGSFYIDPDVLLRALEVSPAPWRTRVGDGECFGTISSRWTRLRQVGRRQDQPQRTHNGVVARTRTDRRMTRTRTTAALTREPQRLMRHAFGIARFSGRCPACRRRILPGDYITRALGCWIHRRCLRAARSPAELVEAS